VPSALFGAAPRPPAAFDRQRFSLLSLLLLTQIAGPAAGGQIELPVPDAQQPIVISSQRADRWQEGSHEVWVLHGRCEIRQGANRATSRDAVLWVDRADAFSSRPHLVIAYLEGQVAVDFPRPGAQHVVSGRSAQTMVAESWLGRFHSHTAIQIQAPVASDEPTVKPAVYQRGLLARKGDPPAVQPAQFTQPEPLPAPASPVPASGRRIRVFPRSSVRVQARWFPSPSGQEWIAVIDSGVNVLIDGVDALGSIDVATDRLVIWTTGQQPDLSGQSVQGRDVPLEFYMEGNIVFRQGTRVIYADSMYYNVRQETGVVLQAEVLTPVSSYQGLLRLKADVFQQLDRHRFLAHNASVTSSRLGVPRYWFQSERITYQDIQQPLINPFTGQAAVDPQSGDVAVDHEMLATSRNNFVYMGGLPVFYWPFLASDLTEPTYYLRSLRVNNDNVFGTQVLTDWDMYQLLGIRNPPPGTDWTASVDYLSERGWGLGTVFAYEGDQLWRWPGPYAGRFDVWGIDDQGLDDLGADRRALVPEKELRGRLLWEHRHYLASGFQFTGQAAWISDRNFLQEYFEREWDEQDLTTGLELKRLVDNGSWAVTADARLNEFFTQTEWLPRLDHFRLGQPLWGDRLTWYEHTSVGYARLRTASEPLDPVDASQWHPLPWEVTESGLRAASRQELNLPLEMGPVKVVPYLLGELGYWQADLNGAEVTRAYGQAGVRASLPMWRADSQVRSPLFNLNGLAHKVQFDADFFWADASQDLDTFPLYDPLDDDSVEAFRRRIFYSATGDVTPPGVGPLTVAPQRLDERYFALRSGMQRWVTGASTEIADDLTVLRLGVRQRWQTRRGLPGREQTMDWIVLDFEGSLFPDAERDNFGQEVGLLNYDFRWHVGDRLTLLSDGFLDVFADGLRMFTIGGVITRPGRGSYYAGFRSLEGPISSNVLAASYNYRLSEKWILNLGSSTDLSSTGNIVQTGYLTRVGESFLVSLGLHADQGRDTVGVRFAIEPRFLPSSRLGWVGGQPIPPVGALGLE